MAQDWAEIGPEDEGEESTLPDLPPADEAWLAAQAETDRLVAERASDEIRRLLFHRQPEE